MRGSPYTTTSAQQLAKKSALASNSKTETDERSGGDVALEVLMWTGLAVGTFGGAYAVYSIATGNK